MIDRLIIDDNEKAISRIVVHLGTWLRVNPVLRDLEKLAWRCIFEELAILDFFILKTLPQLLISLAINGLVHVSRTFFAFIVREALEVHVSIEDLNRSCEVCV